jgi:hypothetical protein
MAIIKVLRHQLLKLRLWNEGRTADPPRWHEVEEGVKVGSLFGVHHPLEGNTDHPREREGWSITHLPTGLSCSYGMPFPTQAVAIKVAKALYGRKASAMDPGLLSIRGHMPRWVLPVDHVDWSEGWDFTDSDQALKRKNVLTFRLFTALASAGCWPEDESQRPDWMRDFKRHMTRGGHMIYVLTPAYGRQYQTKRQALEDFLKNRDFMNESQRFSGGGTYINREQMGPEDRVEIYFNANLTRQVACQVGKVEKQLAKLRRSRARKAVAHD